MTITYKDRTHTSQGMAGTTPHTGGGKPHSGATKNRLQKALEAREARLAARKMKKNKDSSVPKPKRKPSVPKVPTITGPKAKPARRPTMKEQREAGNAVLIDYDQLEKLSQKAGGGKVTYRMSGGQVVAKCYD